MKKEDSGGYIPPPFIFVFITIFTDLVLVGLKWMHN